MGESILTVIYQTKDGKNSDFKVEQTFLKYPSVYATSSDFDAEAIKTPALVIYKDTTSGSEKSEAYSRVSFRKFSDLVSFKNIRPWNKESGKVNVEDYFSIDGHVFNMKIEPEDKEFDFVGRVSSMSGKSVTKKVQMKEILGKGTLSLGIGAFTSDNKIDPQEVSVLSKGDVLYGQRVP